MTYAKLTYEVEGDVGLITLSRADARNALTHTTYAELEDAVRTTPFRCLVITGADAAFCSGDEVRQVMLAAGDPTATRLRAESRITPVPTRCLAPMFRSSPRQTGPRSAGGWSSRSWPTSARIRRSSLRRALGKAGLCCDVAGVGRLAQLVGRQAPADLLFTGRLIDAREARELRPVSRVVPHRELLACALDLARRIAANPPPAVQRLKHVLRRAPNPDWPTSAAG